MYAFHRVFFLFPFGCLIGDWFHGAGSRDMTQEATDPGLSWFWQGIKYFLTSEIHFAQTVRGFPLGSVISLQ